MSTHSREPARDRRPDRLRLGPHGTGDQGGPLLSACTLDGPLSELASLFGADTPQALQQALVIPTRGTATDCSDAVSVFRRVYDGDTTGLTECVALVCTSRRWRKVGRQLLDDLIDHRVLDSGVTGTLANTFLQADDVAVTAPGAWLGDFYAQLRDGTPHPLDPTETYTLRAPVPPQLRRWAARESVRQPDDVAAVRSRALRLDSRHGAAVVLGLLDATDRLDAETTADVLDIGLDWPSASVRLPALERLAATGRGAEALERAEGDRAEHVREWAATHRQRTLLDGRDQVSPDSPPDSDDAPVSPRREAQPTLFG